MVKKKIKFAALACTVLMCTAVSAGFVLWQTSASGEENGATGNVTVSLGDHLTLTGYSEEELAAIFPSEPISLARGQKLSDVMEEPQFDAKYLIPDDGYTVTGGWQYEAAKPVTMRVSGSTNYVLYSDGTVWRNGEQQRKGNGEYFTDALIYEPGTRLNNLGSRTSEFVVCADGTVWACGANNYGKLGIGSTETADAFTQVQKAGGGTFTNAVSVFAGLYSTFIECADGTLWAAGWNRKGDLGIGENNVDGNVTQFTQVEFVDGRPGVGVVSCTDSYSNDQHFVILEDGTVWAAGEQSGGEFGMGEDTQTLHRFTELKKEDGTSFNAVAMDSYNPSTTFILCADGTVWAAGQDFNGMFGMGEGAQRLYHFTELKKEDGTSFDAVSLAAMYGESSYNVRIVCADGSVWVSGTNNNKELGVPNNRGTFYRYTEAKKTGDVPFDNAVKVFATELGTMILCSDGTVWGAGIAAVGTDGYRPYDEKFVQIKTADSVLEGVSIVAFDKLASFLLCEDGTIWQNVGNAYFDKVDGYGVKTIACTWDEIVGMGYDMTVTPAYTDTGVTAIVKNSRAGEDVEYTSLKEAFENSQGQYNMPDLTIQLQHSITLTEYLQSTYAHGSTKSYVTIDLNGYILNWEDTPENADYSFVFRVDTNTLTISSAAAEPAQYGFTVSEEGYWKLDADGGRTLPGGIVTSDRGSSKNLFSFYVYYNTDAAAAFGGNVSVLWRSAASETAQAGGAGYLAAHDQSGWTKTSGYRFGAVEGVAAYIAGTLGDDMTIDLSQNKVGGLYYDEKPEVIESRAGQVNTIAESIYLDIGSQGGMDDPRYREGFGHAFYNVTSKPQNWDNLLSGLNWSTNNDVEYDGEPLEFGTQQNEGDGGLKSTGVYQDDIIYNHILPVSSRYKVNPEDGWTDGMPTDAGMYYLSITWEGSIDLAQGQVIAPLTFEPSGRLIIPKAAPRAEDFALSMPDGAVYDGSAKSASAEFVGAGTGCGAVMVKYSSTPDTYTATDPTAAGTYYVFLDVADGTNYKAATDLHAADWSFTVAKAGLTLGVTLEGWTYGEAANAPEITGNLGSGAVTYRYEGINGTEYDGATAPTEAGNYKLTATVAETANYLGGTASCEFVVRSPDQAELTLSVTLEGWTYGEAANAPEITGNLGNGTVTYLYEGINGTQYSSADAPAAAGSYKLTVTVAETHNYLSGTASVEFTVAKAGLAPGVTLEGWTYGETANAPEITGNLGNGTVTYLYEGINGTQYSSADAPAAAGSYKLTVTVAETHNYLSGTASCEFTIAKAGLSLRVTLNGWTAGGTANAPVIAGNLGNGTVTYLYESTDGTQYSSAAAPTAAGSYKLTVTIAETENYLGGTASVEFVIAAAPAPETPEDPADPETPEDPAADPPQDVGAIVGLAIAGAAVVGAGVGLGVILWRRKRK